MAEWLTYEELAARLEIKFEAARQRANRAGWLKRRRSDGKTVVQYVDGTEVSPILSLTAAPDAFEVRLPSVVNDHHVSRIEDLEAENAALKQEIAAKKEKADTPTDDDLLSTTKTASRSTQDVALIARNRFLESEIVEVRAAAKKEASRAERAEDDWASCAIELRDVREEVDSLKDQLERAMRRERGLEAEFSRRLSELEAVCLEDLARCESYAELGPIGRFLTPAPAVSSAKLAFRPLVRTPTSRSDMSA